MLKVGGLRDSLLLLVHLPKNLFQKRLAGGYSLLETAVTSEPKPEGVTPTGPPCALGQPTAFLQSEAPPLPPRHVPMDSPQLVSWGCMASSYPGRTVFVSIETELRLA